MGDKTLLDTLIPAASAFKKAVDDGETFERALKKMSEKAEQGMLSTKDMIAKVGRASRLGERSRGVLMRGPYRVIFNSFYGRVDSGSSFRRIRFRLEKTGLQHE